MRRRRAAASPSPGPSAAEQPPQEREPELSEWRRRLERWDEGWCCAPRFGLAWVVFWAGQFVTYLAARSAFSGEANQRGALQDRMHDLLGYCDQAGRSTELGACPPFWQPIADMLPDKLALITMGATLALYVASAWRQRGARERCCAFIKLVAESACIFSLLMVLRAATVASTVMPAPSPLCRNATSWAHGEGGLPTSGWLMSPIACNDAMFSGHTITYSVALVFWLYSHAPSWAKLAWSGYFAFCCVASFATRDHYTADVLVAVYVSVPICMHREATIRRLFADPDIHGHAPGELAASGGGKAGAGGGRLSR